MALTFDPEGEGRWREHKDALRVWIAGDARRGQAHLIEGTRKLVWSFDGQLYSASGLVAEIAERAFPAGTATKNQGTMWWVDEDGRRLSDILTARS